MKHRKALISEYKKKTPPMGVWSVRNKVDGKYLLGASPNVTGRLNRERFSLETGAHLSRELQADWNRLGKGSFVFEVLDTLEPPADPDADVSEELDALLAMWTDKLNLAADKLYRHRD